MSGIRKRIYVGNILQNEQSCLKELHGRFAKFGRCLSDEFEKHDSYAYINMDFDDESQFQRLKKSFNNVKFKGNELRVNLAKPSWKETWQQRHKEEEMQSRRMDKVNRKRDWEYYKKIENIGMSWEDRRSLIPGRVRKSQRRKAQMRNITFRVNVGGSLKVYKCYKTKLWGYERDKDLKDLVFKFVNDKWRDGCDHIVDRLDYGRSKRSVLSILDLKPLEAHVAGADDVEAEEEKKEKEKVKDVLTSVLRDFEFDKPLQLSDEEDFSMSSSKPTMNQKHGLPKRGQEEEPNLPSEPSQEEFYQKEGEKDEDGDDEEFIPTFSAQKDAPPEQTGSGEISNTETLRNLFNPESNDPTSSFKLIAESDDDIDHKNDEEFKEITAAPQEVSEEVRSLQNKERQHLFFPHFSSPFLVGQTKLSKLKSSDISETLSNWDEMFWENRGIWTKEMKRRQRDALRLLNKKRAKKNGGILL
ncbi:hypothetical protein HG536_0E00260 [Torulaspora globosa]|uniref:RRM domain-containing protein n=1 Tax=Torulaspora globosa TaxID=48254 RepID=A0A7G3ZHY0_9SACH|nr:uncharacterized protein HG536_0E00260 [Torulaspora globosa]QLL33116.1 hypothetical protein HG536_0E00260 [Torulaspora globosa]